MCGRWNAIPSRGRSADVTKRAKLAFVLMYDEEELRAFKAAQEMKIYKPAVDTTSTNADNPDKETAGFVVVYYL